MYFFAFFLSINILTLLKKQKQKTNIIANSKKIKNRINKIVIEVNKKVTRNTTNPRRAIKNRINNSFFTTPRPTDKNSNCP